MIEEDGVLYESLTWSAGNIDQISLLWQWQPKKPIRKLVSKNHVEMRLTWRTKTAPSVHLETKSLSRT